MNKNYYIAPNRRKKLLQRSSLLAPYPIKYENENTMPTQ